MNIIDAQPLFHVLLPFTCRASGAGGLTLHLTLYATAGMTLPLLATAMTMPQVNWAAHETHRGTDSFLVAKSVASFRFWNFRCLAVRLPFSERLSVM
jgi:hypothetical protein